MKRFGAVASTALKGIGIAAAAGAAVGLKQAASAAIEAEKSQARMETQLRALGTSFRRHGAEIDAVIQKTSRLAGIDDEELQDAFTNIARASGSVEKGMKGVGLAADIARAKNMDTAKAGELVGKVMAGNTGILARYGIVLEEGASKQEAIAALQEKFSGQAAAYGKTTQGSVDRASVAWENLMELLGAKVAPVIRAVADVITNLTDRNAKGGKVARQVVDAYRDYLRFLMATYRQLADGVRQWAETHQEELRDIRRAGQNLVEFVREQVIPAFKAVWPVVRDVLKQVGVAWANTVGLIVDLINGDFGKAFDKYKNILQAAREATNRIMGAIGRLIINSLKKAAGLVGEAAEAIGKGIWSGIKSGLKKAIDADSGFGQTLRGFLGPLGQVGNAIGAATGDGIGKSMAPMVFQGGTGTAAGLMGANSALRPFATIGSKFGLGVTSGARTPGGKTSTGGISYHGSGEALDIAGPASGMLGFFNYMKKRFGSVLAELIYTPGGAGIKDGNPYTYTGITAAQHYDHVHVALDLGQPGPGIGDGPGRRKPRTGDGIGTAVRAAWAAGFRGNALKNMVAIAGRESSYNPRAQNLVPPDHSIGLWQINQLAHRGRYGTDAQLMNPVTNAKAAYALFKQSGYGPWVGVNYGNAASYLDDAERAIAAFKQGGYLRGNKSGGSSGASGGAGGSAGKLSGSFGGMITSGAFAGSAKGFGGTATGKAGGVKVGLPGGGVGEMDLPSGTDYIDAMIAEAALTPGLADDKNAAGALVAFWAQKLKEARASRDPRKVTEAATGLKGAQDALAQLTDAITDATRVAEERAAIDKEIVENQRQILAVAKSQPNQLLNALIDAVNGGIGGRSGLGFETPSFAGGLARA